MTPNDTDWRAFFAHRLHRAVCLPVGPDPYLRMLRAKGVVSAYRDLMAVGASDQAWAIATQQEGGE